MRFCTYFIFALSLLSLVSCEKDDAPSKKYRTVFFGDGSVEAVGIDGKSEFFKVRIMMDTTAEFNFLFSTELWEKFPPGHSSINYDITDETTYPYYATHPTNGVLECAAMPFLLSDNWQLSYESPLGDPRWTCRIANFARQRQATDRYFDVVVGKRWARLIHVLTAPSIPVPSWTGWENAYVTLESGEKVKILDYFADEKMQVPYDWDINAIVTLPGPPPWP